IGFVRYDMAEAICPYAGVFVVSDKAVVLAADLKGFDERTEAVGRVLKDLYSTGIMSPWRDELYPVTAAFGDPPLFVMERAAVPLFGIRAYGVHLNGYVRQDDRLFMWIGRRSRHKHTYPGLLDNTVAGGLPYGLSARDCLVKECE